MLRALQFVQQASTADEELRALQKLHEAILDYDKTKPNNEIEMPDTFKEHELLSSKKIAEDLPKEFVVYCFGRRYGWSECETNESGISSSTDSSKWQTTSRTFLPEEHQYKSKINDILDLVIKWLTEQPMSVSLLAGFQFAIAQAQNRAVVRNRIFVHIMEWLKSVIEVVTEDEFQLIKSIILSGVTDVWSAIRNACVSRLSQVFEHFTVLQLKDFFNEAVKICKDNDSSWQAKEGSLMTINCMTKRLRWIGLIPDEPTEMLLTEGEISSPRMQYFLKFGKEELNAIPEFISTEVDDIIYEMLRHPQISVRENAIKAYATYISRCEFKVALASFNTIMEKLQQGTLATDGSMSLPHFAVLNSEFVFLDAYYAESLLGLCVNLVKHIPPGFLLPHWPVYFSTFSLHLMHPASTVRQAASTVFKFIVAKDSSNPITLRLVLQGLVAPWKPDMTYLTKKHDWLLPSAEERSRLRRASVIRLPTTVNNEKELSNLWEFREGRLLAYELILQFLIKNHWLYTFGMSQMNQPIEEQDEISSMSHACVTASSGTHGIPKGSFHQSFKAKPPPPITAWGHGSKDTAVQDTGMICRREYGQWRVRSYSECQSGTAPSHTLQHPTCHYVVEHMDRYTANDSDKTEAQPEVRRRSERRLSLASKSVSEYEQPALQTLSRHYTYYTKSPLTSTNARSLLMHARLRDTLQGAGAAKDSDLLTELMRSVKDTTMFGLTQSESTSKEDGAPDWIDEVQLSSLKQLLQTVLYQTIESVMDTRWEVKRMGQQLLPVVVETIRWYDMEILSALWDRYLSADTTVLTYGSCLALKYSLEHAARLQQLLQHPPASWQDIASCKAAMQQIIGTMRLKVSEWCKNSAEIVKRSCLDLLSCVAMETLLLACSNFQLDAAEVSNYLNLVISLLQHVTHNAHPLKQSTSPGDRDPPSDLSIIPHDGFLSCLTKADLDIVSSYRQIEQSILSHLHISLYSVCSATSVLDISSLFSLLAFYVGAYIDDDTLSRSLLDSLLQLGQSVDKLLRSTTEKSSVQSLVRDIALGLKELATLISVKSLTVQMLKQVLSLYMTFVSDVPLEGHLLTALQSICCRLGQIPDSASVAYEQTEDTDLSLRSNEIPALPLDNDEPATDDEDDAILDPVTTEVMAQTHLLNLSGSSRSSLSPRLSATTASAASIAEKTLQRRSTTSESSDWDDWSDTEQDTQTEINNILAQFIKNLKSQASHKGRNKFNSTVALLQPQERKVMLNLLAK